MSDLPELPEDFDPEELTPDAFAAPPAVDPADLTCADLDLIREWLWHLAHDPSSLLAVRLLGTDQLDRSLAILTDTYRMAGIDLRDKRDLLVSYFNLQINLITIQHDWEECEDPHTYIHFARPLSNLALGFELLLLDVFGEEAAFFPEEV